jgi:antitoxin component of MazEF toxin-antitoxin module
MRRACRWYILSSYTQEIAMSHAATTRAFPNGRSTAVRIPSEFGVKPGDELVVELVSDGSIRLSRARGLNRFLALLERVGPLKDGELVIPRMGPARKVRL